MNGSRKRDLGVRMGCLSFLWEIGVTSAGQVHIYTNLDYIDMDQTALSPCETTCAGCVCDVACGELEEGRN